jgi:hypothetical protein
MKYIGKPYFKEYLLLDFYTFTSRIMEKKHILSKLHGTRGGER